MTFPSLYPLYIDPGTGSMLFSVLLGLLATLYFVGRALIIKFKFVLTGKKSDTSADTQNYVIFCEGVQYINVFLPVLEAFEKRKIPLLYYTSVKDDPAFDASYTYITPEYIGEGNTAIARLNFLKATICLMTTPRETLIKSPSPFLFLFSSIIGEKTLIKSAKYDILST